MLFSPLLYLCLTNILQLYSGLHIHSLYNCCNTTIIVELPSRILQEDWKFAFDPINHHIACLPHIYNICVQHMLSNYLNANFTDCPHVWTNSVGKTVYKDEHVDGLCTDSIKQRRDVVHSVCSSGQHQLNFQ